jgi:hypothetical protein
MWSGIGLFALAMLIAGYIYYSKIFSVDISNLSSFHLVSLGDKALTVSVVVNNKNRNIFFIV